MSCLLAGAMAITLAGDEFTLDWTHSVEWVTWRETWAVEGKMLHLRKAAIKGSGAGMDPAPDAVLRDGWWVWSPRLAPQDSIMLAASGATPSPWHICDGAGTCHDIGAEPAAPVTIRACP